MRRSESGVVNIYDETCFHERNPKPLKALLNLTTAIDTLQFNHDRLLPCIIVYMCVYVWMDG